MVETCTPANEPQPHIGEENAFQQRKEFPPNPSLLSFEIKYNDSNLL